MGTRPTRKAGIYKPRTVSDPQVLKALNSIIERLEVLDGIRGDNLDQAITWRDLGNTGFTLGTGAGGAPTIVNTPGGGTTPGGVPVPEIGPAGPPTDLAANETYLALLLTWTNTDFNLQHVEVWRNDKPDFSDATGDGSPAVMIGTTVSPQFIDYVGANATYYYWVRSVGTDGTYSAFNNTAGTLGTTGIDPGEITLDPDNFKLIDGVDVINPFLVGTVGGDTAVGSKGQLLIDGSIRAEAMYAGVIGALQLNTFQLSAVTADLGVITAGLIRTALPNAFRVEIQDQASTFYPFWYGSGAKGDPNTTLVSMNQNGDVTIKGLLDASMIRQSYFTPASSGYDPFKIACSYPSNPGSFSGGSYTGKEAHLFPVKVIHQDDLGSISGWYPIGGGTEFYSFHEQFLGPLNSSTKVFGRVGTYAELFWMTWSFEIENVGTSPTEFVMMVDYRYDNNAYTPTTTASLRHKVTVANGRRTYPTFTCMFRSKSTAWNTLDIRVRGRYVSGFNNLAGRVHWFTASIHAPNFGISDQASEIPVLA